MSWALTPAGSSQRSWAMFWRVYFLVGCRLCCTWLIKDLSSIKAGHSPNKSGTNSEKACHVMTGISVSMELCLRIRLKVCKVLVLMSFPWNGKAVETVNTFCGQKLSLELDLFLSSKERMQNKPKMCSCNGKILISLELLALSNHLHTQLLFMQTWKLFMETSDLPWNDKLGGGGGFPVF